MALYNVISVPTPSGVKLIEIHNDDITKLSWEVDVLVFAVFKGRYNPREGTIIEGLESNCGVDISALAKEPLFDLRSDLNTWVSKPLKLDRVKHLLCIEGMSDAYERTGSVTDMITDLFGTLSVADFRGVDISSVAIPIVGIGRLGVSADAVIEPLISKTIEMLEKVSSVKNVYFVHRRSDVVEMIDREVNRLLKRADQELSNLFDNDQLKKALEGLSRELIKVKESGVSSKAIDDMLDKIVQGHLKPYELGTLSRRVLESCLTTLFGYPANEAHTIHEMLAELRKYNVSPWLLSYAHLIRIFGNESSHDQVQDTVPNAQTEDDMLIAILSLKRSLEFYQMSDQLKPRSKHLGTP